MPRKSARQIDRAALSVMTVFDHRGALLRQVVFAVEAVIAIRYERPTHSCTHMQRSTVYRQSTDGRAKLNDFADDLVS